MPDPLVLRTWDEEDAWLAEEIGDAGVKANEVIGKGDLLNYPDLGADPAFKKIKAKFLPKINKFKAQISLLVNEKKNKSPSQARRKVISEKLKLLYPIVAKLQSEWTKATHKKLGPAYPFSRRDLMTFAGERFNLLTKTSKMACFSFGIKSMENCPGSDASIALNTPERVGICWQCYASAGAYAWKDNRCRSSARGLFTGESEDFVDTMIEAILDPRKYAGNKDPWTDLSYFRIHDSGDVYSPVYAKKWLEIIEALPQINFWMPTRSWADQNKVRKNRIHSVLKRINAQKNCVVRPSGLAFNDFPPKVAGLSAGATSHFHKSPSSPWNLVRKDSEGRIVDDFGTVLPKDNNRKRKRIENNTWLCPATFSKAKDFNCASAEGPDGRSPCRVCWGRTGNGKSIGKWNGKRVDYSKIPIAYGWH